MTAIIVISVCGSHLCPHQSSPFQHCRTQSRWLWSHLVVSGRMFFVPMRLLISRTLKSAQSLSPTKSFSSVSPSSTLLYKTEGNSALSAGISHMPSLMKTLSSAGDSWRPSLSDTKLFPIRLSTILVLKSTREVESLMIRTQGLSSPSLGPISTKAFFRRSISSPQVDFTTVLFQERSRSTSTILSHFHWTPPLRPSDCIKTQKLRLQITWLWSYSRIFSLCSQEHPPAQVRQERR